MIHRSALIAIADLPSQNRKQKREDDTQKDGCRQRKIERGVAASKREVAGQPSDRHAGHHQQANTRDDDASNEQQSSHVLPQIDPGEEIADFKRRRIRCIRPVGGVVLDRASEFLAQRAGVRLRRICCAHQPSPLFDRIRRLEREHDHRAGRHELRQAGEKRPFAMHRVEAFGVLFRQMQHPHGTDLESCLFNAPDDVARVARGHSVRLDNREGAFHDQEL